MSLRPATAAVALLLAVAAVSSAGAQRTVVRVRPAQQTIEPGETLRADIVVEDVSSLAAFEFTLTFDSNVIAYQGISVGGFLGSSGREVNCFAPTITPSSVSQGCSTLGDDKAGATGSGVLASVSFSAVVPGESQLSLTRVGLAKPDSSAIDATSSDASVTITAIATPKATATAMSTGTAVAGTTTPSAATPLPSPTAPPPEITPAVMTEPAGGNGAGDTGEGGGALVPTPRPAGAG